MVLNTKTIRLLLLSFAWVGCQLNAGEPYLVSADDLREVQQLFYAGNYQACADQIESVFEDGGTDEEWFLLKIDAEMALGRYKAALKTLDHGLEENRNSIRLRWRGRDVCRFNDEFTREQELLIELEDMINFRSWRYRSVANQVTIAGFMFDAKIDPKKVLDDVLVANIQKDPNYAETYLTIGDLALRKHDYALAADHYRKATELEPKNPRGFMGLAHAFKPSDTEESNKALQKVFEINKNHIPANLYVIDDRIDSERYEEAESIIKKVLAINPNKWEALAYRAVVAHLMNRSEEEEDQYRRLALSKWKSNPGVDHLIGKKLSQKYRFAEGARYQRRALTYDPDFIPAKMQLANDLLRLGNEREGWKLADEVYDQDGYNVVAHNLVTLGNHMGKFVSLEAEGFIVRMDPWEAKVYGQLALDLLIEAKQQLGPKYEAEIQTPIIVEIFPQQQDFAIRTFGLPGGAGFLGVCFGRVITMNSPATQSVGGNNWQSVLWHEFCHVVTLQKTKNKMPRWLSEGISVYEESQRDPSWGQSMTPRFREMVLGDDLTPVSKLSGAFLNPPSPEHLQFAYFESSLVVEYIIETYGIDVLKRMLDDLAIGMSINQVLDRYTGSVQLLDKEFAAYARDKANATAVDADWSLPDLDPQSDADAWAAWLEKHPNNYPGLLRYVAQLIKQQRWADAQQPLEHMIDLFPDFRGAEQSLCFVGASNAGVGQTPTRIGVVGKSGALAIG